MFEKRVAGVVHQPPYPGPLVITLRREWSAVTGNGVSETSSVDLTVPNSARVYDYFLGGAHNTQVDREFADKVLHELPSVATICQLNRSWLRRVVEFALDQGVRQFLDIGSGLPTTGHIHEIAQDRVPDARVVYVDNEPVAVAHSHRVLADVPNTAMVSVNAEDPESIFAHPDTRRVLDFDQPIMLVLAALVHFVPDSRDPASLIAGYAKHLAPGSYLALSHDTGEHQGEEMRRAVQLYEHSSNPLYLRDRNEIAALFAENFTIVEPGIVFTPEWRPANPADVGEHPEQAGIYAAVGRKQT